MFFLNKSLLEIDPIWRIDRLIRTEMANVVFLDVFYRIVGNHQFAYLQIFPRPTAYDILAQRN